MDFPCLIRRPAAISSQHSPPLLVLLHGKGANEEDLFGLARHADPRFMVASLRAPHEMAPGYADHAAYMLWRGEGHRQSHGGTLAETK